MRIYPRILRLIGPRYLHREAPVRGRRRQQRRLLTHQGRRRRRQSTLVVLGCNFQQGRSDARTPFGGRQLDIMAETSSQTRSSGYTDLLHTL
eukprot:8401165-Pyramimonas_sp.AAC.2